MKKLPGTMSIQRTIVMSDAVMLNVYDNNDKTPVNVIRHGIRGTQNINNGHKDGEVNNIQETDTAKLDPLAKAMAVEFSIKFIDISQCLTQCSPHKSQDRAEIATYRESLKAFIEKAKTSKGLEEVALRFARNIANARFLWRNRIVAENIQVNVIISGSDEPIIFDAISIPLNEFGDYSADEKRLAKVILDGMTDSKFSSIKVSAVVDFGISGAIEVYPSQNYIDGKPKGFARSLYKHNIRRASDKTDMNIVGHAAIRDQKVLNALRTFDTWYADYAERKSPIAIEPNGASLDAQMFFRNNKESSAFDLFLTFDKLDPNTKEGMFCLACLIRGGVYSGESDKKDGSTAKKGKKGAEETDDNEDEG